VAAYLGSRAEGGRQLWRSLMWPPTRDRDLGPMWFVAAFLVCSVVYALYRQFRTAPTLGPTALTTQRLAVWVLAIGAADFAVWLRWGLQQRKRLERQLGPLAAIGGHVPPLCLPWPTSVAGSTRSRSLWPEAAGARPGWALPCWAWSRSSR
jgi:hypothetical protein